ncbi:phosphoribosylamine--glycine ligase [Turneriella parva]|uniref:phosphoribosylamine--glycine ligase n=1 Tax=Turneriella parva (strain ATCC BAA-1111 / DSM 21527 / NCTC 11395 / H) TaxID=869212 RepID=I4B8D1_TURPD|nr:phosphoribosylamine--glycine ligase [Turneriella parva]AFM13538.1 phosphoribosylamine--glycine ligase [Turneriella parva DSM 21527]
MRILILGSGGREHALYRKIKESSHARKVFVWPGNGLIPAEDRVRSKAVADSFTELAEFITREKIDFTVVGNEAPLVAGVRDFLKDRFPGHPVFGPDALGAQLEGSKAFSDDFMREAKIPHGTSVIADSLAAALAALPSQDLPLVLKADGLAAGKGVSIHHDLKSAEEKLKEIFDGRIFGDSGNRVLLQKFLHGTEASLFALCNGREAMLLPVARDYKRALTGDLGDNTGGMGAYCPGEHLTEAQKIYVHEKIIEPVLKKFAYRGLLYVGLMIRSERADDLAVVEFNCRFGDPETQSILHLIEGDLLEYLLWTDDAQPQNFPLIKAGSARLVPYRRGSVVNVVLAAKGYPGAIAKDIPLVFPEPSSAELHVTGAGIESQGGKLLSTSGRIANVVAWGKDRDDARARVYAYLEEFSKANSTVTDRLYWREDIAASV